MVKKNIEKKTSKQWADDFVLPWFEIIDFDGWDRENLYFSFFEEKITRDEFNHRIIFSTIKGVNPKKCVLKTRKVENFKKPKISFSKNLYLYQK